MGDQKADVTVGESHRSTYVNVSCRTFSPAALLVGEHLPGGQHWYSLYWGSDIKHYMRECHLQPLIQKSFWTVGNVILQTLIKID